jgi:glutamate/tyrosine decarboxylase-like PLP-dependent enzyme
MRRLGYAVVDRIVEHLEGLRDAPPLRVGDPEALRAQLGGPPPEEPGEPQAALDALFDDVLPWMQHGDHPRFFARIGSPGNYVSALADAAAAGLNVFAGSWVGGSGPATVELVVLDWLRELCGMPEGTEGVLTSGGSVANLAGLAAARAVRLGEEHAPEAVAYTSDQAHASVPRGLRTLGFAPEQVRLLASDGRFALTGETLRAAVEADLAAGRRPFCAIATAGTTSSGTVDELPALAAVCREHGLWLHVDGAYGAPAALSDAGRAALEGLELADSLVLDPHKWLFQPYEIGCVLVREPGALERAFSLRGPYLRDTLGGAVDFRERGPQLTRGPRALKLWLSVRVFGMAAFREAVARGIALAEHAEALLRERGGWEVVTPAQLAIVTFRRAGADDAEQTRIADAMVAGGFAAPSTTVLGDRVVLRLCTINPRTTDADVEATIAAMERV